jgi:L-threonine kinase
MDANPELYRDFPSEIRLAYAEVVRVTEPYKRHNLVLQLTEVALEYLASLALSDYRSRQTKPSRSVELLLEELRIRNLTMGSTLRLFQASAAAPPNSLFPKGKPLTTRQLPDSGRLSAAMVGINTAIETWQPSASTTNLNVELCVKRALLQTTPRLSWWQAWNELVNYRNYVSHAGSYRWPLYSDRYYDVFAPLFEAAVIEVLTYPPTAAAILNHPLAVVTLIRPDSDGTVTHRVCGEERATWFERDIVCPKRVTDVWTDDAWRATSASKYILERRGQNDFAIRALYWDIRESPPPPLDAPKFPSATASPGSSPATRVAGSTKPLEGRGVAPGTCGEFAQGPLLDGEQFHVTCPINKSATVDVEIRRESGYSVLGLQSHQNKLELALKYTCEYLDLRDIAIHVRWWSDLDIGKGMGSSTADVLAGIRAVTNAVGETLSSEVEGELATRVESSDGTMYPGIAAVNQKTGAALRQWEWYPEFVIVMLVPHDTVLTEAIRFEGKEKLALQYKMVLSEFDSAITARSIERFAATSTQAVELNARYVPNPYANMLSTRLEEVGALGLNVGHTGTVCGLLYPNTQRGRERASEICFDVSQWFPQLKDVKVVTTPQCPQ